MDFNSFPAQWEWVALIIGGVAFLMAIQPVIQVIFGRPKLVAELKVRPTKSGEALICFVKNMPVTNKMLKMLYVHRNPIDDLYATFDILTRDDMQKISDTFVVGFKTPRGERALRTTLSASYLPISFSIIVYNKEKNAAFTMGIGSDKTMWLKGGVYIVVVHLSYGARTKIITKEFSIADTPQHIRIGEQREYNM